MASTEALKKRGRKPENTPANKIKAKNEKIAVNADMYCSYCGEFKKESEFYQSSATTNKHFQKMNVCKGCIEKMYEQLIKEVSSDKRAVYEICSELNLPYIETLCEASIGGKMHTIRGYVTKINSLPQYKGMTFKDGEFSGTRRESDSERRENVEIVAHSSFDEREAVIRWGNTWSDHELIKLEEFYHNMKAKNTIDTPQDDDYLKKLSMLSVKIDRAIMDDESSKAKSLGDLYSKYMTDAKFRAQDMTSADKQGGIRTFSQIYAEVERDDFIPPWEKFANKFGVTQDLVDKTIMHIENFTLRFNKAEKMTTPSTDTPKIDEIILSGEENE